MQTVKIENALFYSFHGCLAEEEKIGGKYSVDLEVKVDFSSSFDSDDLNDTADYSSLYAIVKEEMAIRSKLIEHVAGRIMKRLEKEYSEVFEAHLRLTKQSPPIGGNVEAVVVEVHEKFSR